MSRTPTATLIRPATALQSPAWLMALGVVVASTLPNWPAHALLSSLAVAAMLLVAPAAIATLLGIRTRSGVLACHMVIAQLHVGIQLSPALAALAIMPIDLLGLSWGHVAGPERVLCMVGLAISYLWVTPGVEPQQPVQPLPDPAPRAPLVKRTC